MVEKACIKERTVHGKKNFPLCVYHNVCSKQNVLDYHWHDEAEFIYLVSGEVTFYIDAVSTALKAGEALFVKSGQIHSGRMERPGNCDYYSIVFNMEMLDNADLGDSRDLYINPLAAGVCSLPQFYSGADGAGGKYVINKLASIVSAFFEKPPAFEIYIMSQLYAVVAYMAARGKIQFERKSAERFESYKKERFRQVLEYIHQNYKRKISIEDMARQVSLSPFHFSRFFKAVSGKTPIEYLNEYRIDQASHMLLCSNDKIMEIAFECGFSNFSYFIKLFKESKGCTPGEYRSKFEIRNPKIKQ